MHDCLIAFGSNEGNRGEAFQLAIERLDKTGQVRVSAKSELFQTAPVGGPGKQDFYLNAAIRLETSLDPLELHNLLVEIETDLGRSRRERWGSRKIDLDLLLFDQQQVNTAKLIVPHPRMSFRRFVLEPACEIARNMVHQPSGLTLEQLVNHLDERDELILCVCDEKFKSTALEIAEELTTTCAATKFNFRIVQQLEQMLDLQTKTKLVTFVRTHDIEPDPAAEEFSALWQAAVSFPGPTLELPADSNLAKAEIFAAIDAMSPLAGKPISRSRAEEKGRD
jgi:2-amino-4-hydroxy-6-hydroxymethyldihydropteridine diphosphokinase